MIKIKTDTSFHRRQRRIAPLAAAATLLFLSAPPAGAGEVDDRDAAWRDQTSRPAPADSLVRPRNVSSHDPEFFRALLTGRVWIAHSPDSQGPRIPQNRFRAIYHGPDGLTAGCWYFAEEYRHSPYNWRMVRSTKRALINYHKPGDTLDPKKIRSHWPLFYDPDTGQLHNESWRRDQLWQRNNVGWVQESWPRAMKDACPKLKLPADLPINEKQTSKFMSELRQQDPEAPIRNFPGSRESRTPGGIGIAQARTMGTVPFPVEEFQAFLAERKGDIVTGNSGSRYVLAPTPDQIETWKLDARGKIVDIWTSRVTHDGQQINATSEQTDGFYRYRIGYAYALYPTGERHPAFVLSGRLAAKRHPIPLTAWGRPETLYLGADGSFTGTTGDGGTAGRRWWWSRGNLNLRFQGEDATVLIGWRDLLDRLQQAEQ